MQEAAVAWLKPGAVSLHLEPLPTETGRGPWPELLDPAAAAASRISQKLSPIAGQSWCHLGLFM